MEFNNIHLPSFIIAGLYKHSLVLLDGEITPFLQDGGWQILDDGQKMNVEKQLTHNESATEKLGPVKNEAYTIAAKINEKPNGTIDFQPIAESIGKAPPRLEDASKHDIPSVSNIKYLGGFGKKITIVLEDHFHPHINDGDLAFLTKLLQACQLSLNDVAIINVVSNRNFSSQLWQLMPAEKMIIFEIDPGTLGLPFRLSHFKLQPWSDCVFLASPSLEALQAGNSEKVVQLKRNLWESLKKMFLA